MAWWQFWRSQDAGDGSPAPRVPEPASPSVARSYAAPAWQLLPPPSLQADRPMPLTFDARVQRSLATHTPAESLVAAARPLSHEIRTDGPMGVVSQLMRVVDEPTALAAASMTSGSDLVLRTRRMSPVELDADASLGTLAPSRSPSRVASPSVASAPAARDESAPAAPGESAPGSGPIAREAGRSGPIAREADEVMAPPVTTAEDEPSDRDAEQPDRQITPRAAPSFAPTLADAPVLTGAVHRWTATYVATPLRSLRTAVESSGEAVGVRSPAGFASLTLAPPIPAAAAPTSTPPNSAGRTAPVTRSADPSNATSPAPLVGRRRHVVEVKSTAEPADPAVFRAVDPSNAGASNPMGSDPSESPRSESPRSESPFTRDAAAGSADDASSSSPITRAADVAASADPPVATAGQGPVARPTLGRRPGLGMPMNALPASAIGVQRESDPFAGWNDDADPLLLADRAATPPGPESATASLSTAASATAASSTEVPSASAHRAVDPQAVSTGSAFDLPASAPVPAAAAGVPHAGDTAFDADAARPHGDAGTGVLLQPVAASAPTLGTRLMQRVVDDRSSVSVIGGPGPVTTTVPVQWLVGAARGVPSGTGSGGIGSRGGAPAVDRVAGVADQGVRSSAVSGGGGSIGGSGAGGSTVSRSPASGSPAAPTLGSSDSAAALARPPSSALESATPAGDDALAVIRRLPSAPLPPTDASGSADAYKSVAANGSWGDDWGGTFPGAVVPTERHTGFDEGATPSFGDSSSGDQAPASSPGALRTLSRMPGEAASMSLPVVPLTRFPADSNPIERGSASVSVSASVSGGGPLPVAPIGTSTTIARRAEGMAAAAVPAAGGAGSSGGGSDSSGGSGEDGAAGPSAQYGVESSFVFREADDGGAAASTAATPAAAGEGGAAAGAAAQADSDMDKLAATLYERLRQRLRRELLDDRERAGFALDRVR